MTNESVGLTARMPVAAEGVLLGTARETEVGAAQADRDRAQLGFVSNVTRLWMHDPAAREELFDVIGATADAAGLTFADRGVATIAGTALVGDPYCPLAWGRVLAGETTPELAASVLAGSDDLLDDRGRALVAWARRIAGDQGPATADEIDRLRETGFDTAQILRLTLFVALRIAFSTVNRVLGARPEREYVELLDPVVRDAWTSAFGLHRDPDGRAT